MLPKNIYTVLTKNVGQAIPKEFLEIILSKKPNVFGYAVQDGEGLSVGREEGTPEMVDLETMNTETVGLRSMLCFGWLDKGFNVEDIQPFTINDNNDAPFLAIGLDGDFPKYDTNNGRTQEFNLANEIIIPTLLDICELTDGDIAKLVAACGKPSFNNNYLAAIGHRGVLNILPSEGDCVYAAKDTLGGEPFTWGRTSNLHGWGDVKQEPVKVEEPKKRFSFGSKKTFTTGLPPVIPQDVATKGEAPRASVPAVAKKETPKATGPLPVRPPDWCHHNDDKRSWYQMVGGNLPKGWKHSIPIIPIEGVTPPAKIEDLEAWRVARKKATLSASTVTPAPAATATSAGPVKTATEVKEIKAEENLPIINAKDMEKVLEFAAKHLDGQSVVISDPATLQSIEKKFPPLSEALGTTPHEMLNWPVSGLFGLSKTDPRAIVLMALEYRNLWRNTLKAEDLVGTAKPAATTTVTKTGNTVKVESVANEAPPAKKKMFSFGRKAA